MRSFGVGLENKRFFFRVDFALDFALDLEFALEFLLGFLGIIITP